MAEPYKHDEKRQVADPAVLQRVQPAERFVVQRDSIFEWARRKLKWTVQNRGRAPDDQDHHHDRSDAHDLQGFLTGLVYALGVLPPEIHGHHHGKNRSAEVLRNMPMDVS